MVLSLALVLVSCSATHSVVPEPQDSQELDRFVLIIARKPDGQISHSWEAISSFSLSKHASLPTREDALRPWVQASWTRDCDDEFDSCINTCMKSLTGPNWRHANQGAKAAICRSRCFPSYIDCCRLREQTRALEFPVINDAVDWLKRHREELLVGTVVVIAGVTFVVIVAGSGGTALILVPAALLASAGGSPEPFLATAEP